jgi:hypothetical protein
MKRSLKFENLESRNLLSITSMGDLSANYDYLVITSGTLENSFVPLIEVKEAKGLSTAVVNVDFIYANYIPTEDHTNDTQGQAGINTDMIRSFIKDSYLNHGTRWVLLGGDVEIVPQRGVYVNGGIGITVNDLPTDEYYACLDGSWNGDGDALWAEITDGESGGDIDMTPEVYVGRAPVSNVAETVNFVNKTVQYETITAPNAKQMLLWGDQMDSSIYGSRSCINIRDTVLPIDWKAQVIESYDIPGYHVGAEERLAQLNNNPNIIEHMGHGSVLSTAYITREQVVGLTNSFPFFMYSQSCNAGGFEYDDAISEYYVTSTHGAFAVIMNSRSGWYDSAGRLLYNHVHAKAFMDQILNHGVLHLGEANEAAKAEMRATVGKLGFDRWVELETNLLGDPETSMQIGNDVYIPGITITITSIVDAGNVMADNVVIQDGGTLTCTSIVCDSLIIGGSVPAPIVSYITQPVLDVVYDDSMCAVIDDQLVIEDEVIDIISNDLATNILSSILPKVDDVQYILMDAVFEEVGAIINHDVVNVELLSKDMVDIVETHIKRAGIYNLHPNDFTMPLFMYDATPRAKNIEEKSEDDLLLGLTNLQNTI